MSNYLNKWLEILIFKVFLIFNHKDAKIDLFVDEGLSPFLYVEVDGADVNDGTVLFYGHMDK